VEIWTATIAGKARYSFDDANVEIDRGNGAKSIALADVSRVTCAGLGAMRVCELQLRDGSRQAMSTEQPTAEFKHFIEALHVKLAERDGIVFTRGSWMVVGVLAAIGVLVIALGALLYAGVVVPPPIFRGKAMLIMIFGLAWCFVGPVLVWRSRPRPYDPRAPLDVLA
jgi:hypothetical protein